MPASDINILSTRSLPPAIIEQAASKGVLIDIAEQIRTEAINDHSLQEELKRLEQERLVVVITSMNAMNSIKDHIRPADWIIYCIGGTTKALIAQEFPDSIIKGTALNARELAQCIIDDQIEQDVHFFCGDQRRDELPQLLAEKDIAVKEHIVYRTIATPVKVNKKYHAALFFSPSAVESFFSINEATAAETYFAIGETTAKTVCKYCDQVITANVPHKEQLVDLAIQYFKTQPINNNG